MFLKTTNFLKKHYQIIISVVLFGIIFLLGFPFYKSIILLLEFIVILEVVKMVSEFLEKRKLRLRFVLDVFIIFLIRDVIILTTDTCKNYFDILFLLFVIFIFFIFRIMALKYSPNIIGKK